MKRRIYALALALLLLPIGALAQSPQVDMTPADMLVAQLMDQVMAAQTEAEQIDLVLAAVAAHPEDLNVLLVGAQLLFYVDSQDRYAEDCEAMLRKALELAEGEEHVAVVQALAEQLLYAGRIEEALALVTDAMEDYPEQETLKTIMATTLYYNGDQDAAIALLETLLEDSPDNLDAMRLRATILLDECRWDDAMQAYRQISDQWPMYLDGLYGQYMTSIAAGEFEQGVRIIDTLLNNGGDQSLWVTRARVRLWNQYRPEEALSETEALLRANPDDIEAAVVQLVSLLMLERYDEALAMADRVGELDADHGLLLRGITLMNDNRWEEAEAVLTALTEQNPQHYIAHRSLATVRLDGYDDVDGALAALQSAFAITGEAGDVDLFQTLGRIRSRQGDLLQAARAFTAADALIRDDPLSLYYLVITCMDAGEPEALSQAVQRLKDRYPGWYETMVAQVLLEDATGNAQGAVDAFALFEAKFPEAAESLLNLKGMLLADVGDEQGAQLIADAIAESDAPTTQDWDAYAYALTLLGRLDEADEAIENARAALPDADIAQNAGLVRQARLSLLTTEAELLCAREDYDGAVALLQEAAEIGWPPRGMLLNPHYDVLREAEGYDALLAMQPAPESWDASLPPTLP